MDVRHLTTLRELRDRGSVTAVAAALHLSPSAVSQQLAALQRTTPVPLTEQRGRVLALTAAGDRVADAAEEVAAALARAEDAVTDFLTAPQEPVTVTAFHSAGLAWFPSLIERAESEPDGPDVRVRDEDVSTEEFPQLAADHDIVIAHRPFASTPWPQERVAVTSLLEEPIDLAVSRSHPLASRPSVRLSELSGESWSAAHEGFPLEPLLVQAMSAAAGEPIRIRHRVNEFNVVAAIIARTGTVGLLPRYTGLSAQFADRVVLLPIDDLHIGRHIDVLTRRDTIARQSVRTVIDWITAVVNG
ncbi:LysR family transcriptional regulator [Mycetocola reblochoni]|uniref:LysR family transcriptional regulator n=2 Tax=Mycetocola reblochoni TaxID=331618 RepID=A0A3L6ZQ40_9MICO|nr:LysR family transcriptional regulator [Mycetocola reblochoni]RLP69701.1 LysR family transcriptional regulator [Mycetocola reblochoni]SJN18984.1 putative LysR-family transcriptional regulator [Mycetocola reblochoni REB411]